VGLGVALTTVLASLRPGKNAAYVQFDTIRKTQTWYANVYNAGENFSCETVVGLDQKKQYVSTGHIFGKWFSRFMRGARLRMGMVRRQNEALSSKLVIGICAEAEKLWARARTYQTSGDGGCSLFHVDRVWGVIGSVLCSHDLWWPGPPRAQRLRGSSHQQARSPKTK
jgi:hypothetical protein